MRGATSPGSTSCGIGSTSIGRWTNCSIERACARLTAVTRAAYRRGDSTSGKPVECNCLRSSSGNPGMLSNGEGVVVFRDVETASISVLYRRTNGELVLVETEI